MKKLRLKALELGASQLLKREQLKNIIGGCGSTPECQELCNTDSDCYGGSCNKCLSNNSPDGKSCGCGKV